MVLSAQHSLFDVTTQADEADKDFWDRWGMLGLVYATYYT